MRCLKLYNLKRKRERTSLERVLDKMVRDEKPTIRKDESPIYFVRRLTAHDYLRVAFIMNRVTLNYMDRFNEKIGDHVEEFTKRIGYYGDLCREYRKMVLS